MGPSVQRKLSLPAVLLQELGTQQNKGGTTSRRTEYHVSRKDQRKDQRKDRRETQRIQKRQSHIQSNRVRHAKHATIDKRRPLHRADEGNARVQDEVRSVSGSEPEDLELAMSEDDEHASQPHPSKSELDKLAKDDAKIASLEKKLGLKGRKSLPKSFNDDGLGDLLDGLDDDNGSATDAKTKRKADLGEWLAQKRRKAGTSTSATTTANRSRSGNRENGGGSVSEGDWTGSESSQDLGDEDSASGEDGSWLDEDDDANNDTFEGFSDSGHTEPSRARPRRENPYVAPTTNVAKYIPPSLRAPSTFNDEAEVQLRRRIQGLMNRLTNDSIVGIVKELVALYDTNPRQLITSAVTDLILALVCSPENRPEAFFTMVAGFILGAHRAMGTATSAYFVQQLVQVFDRHYQAASGDRSDAASKHLVALLAELYNIQVIACNLIFDYVRLFLEDLSELTTELLLKIVQLSGPLLRRDDPRALGEIVNSIGLKSRKSVSVRASFMIDEMKNLQKNRTKAAARNRDLTEQRSQIKKRIGALGGSQDAQPLRVGLKDIHDSGQQGKWWLVGASWSGNKDTADGNRAESSNRKEVEATVTEADDDLLIPDLWQLAREQGFNTNVRQRIFVALHAGTNFEEAEMLIQKLRLNKHQRKEIPEVIIRSGERQTTYNHYYSVVARHFCNDKELRFQFRRSLTTRFRKMGEEVDTGDGNGFDDFDDFDEANDLDLRRVYNTAKLYGYLVASQSLRLPDLIKYRNLAALQERTHMFMEVLIITILQECTGVKLKGVFRDYQSDIARGIQYFLRKHVRHTDLLDNEKEEKVLKMRCDIVDGLLSGSLARGAR